MTIDTELNLHDIPLLQFVHVAPGVMLRNLKPSDADELLAILDKDPSVRERVTVASRLHSAKDVQTEVDRIAADPWLIRYVIIADDKIVGLISLWKDDGFFGQIPEKNGYGFGYFLDPTMRGKGLMTKSIRKLMETTLIALVVDTFVAYCEDDNSQSIAVLNKLGFRPTNEVYGEPTKGWQERKYLLSREKALNE